MEIFQPPASSSPRLQVNHILLMDWPNIYLFDFPAQLVWRTRTAKVWSRIEIEILEM